MTVDAEILEQPVVAARLLAEAGPEIRHAAERIRGAECQYVVIAARGTSDNAAVYAQYVLGARNRLPVALAAPSLSSVYGAPPAFDGAAVIGISQSGASPDVVSVIDAARSQGCPTIAITETPESALGRAAELVVHLRAGRERAVAATKTYTAELLAVAMLSVALDGSDPASDPRLLAVPDAVAAALAAASEANAAATALADLDRAFVIGRGFEFATARELSLKLKELAGVFAEAYSAADLLHGPLALASEDVLVVAIVPSGHPANGLGDLLTRLRDTTGARRLVLSDRADLRRLGDQSMALPGGLEEWLAPIADIVPGQLFALALARAAGRDPEQPPLIRKVTRTR